MGGSRWCFGKNHVIAVMEFNPLLFGDIKGIRESGYNPEAISNEQLPKIAVDVLQPYVNDKLSLSVNGTACPLAVTKLARNENHYFQVWLAAEDIGFNNRPDQVKIDYRLLFDETDNQHINLSFFYLTDAAGEELQKVLDFSQPDGQYLFESDARVWEFTVPGAAAGSPGADEAEAQATQNQKDSAAVQATAGKPTSAAVAREKAAGRPGPERIQPIRHDPGAPVAKQSVRSGPVKHPVWASICQFILLGIEHILTGYDHMAFLLALIVIGLSIREVLKIITAFTVAHSITLLLAALQLVSLNSRLVELVIAFSICYVALENLLKKEVNYRWMVTFGFGLVHGFGFASVLRELIAGQSNLLVSVVSFNLGVELGQVMIFLVLLPVLHLLKNKMEFRKVTMGTSATIFLLGFTWLIERGFNLKLLPI
jgi:hydrogenase/urease accessory protein HupE